VPGGAAPQVGSYVLYQSPSVDVPNSFVSYTNTIAVNWNQYTIEGWIYVLPKNSWVSGSSTVRTITIGSSSPVTIQIIPNEATAQCILSLVVGGSSVINTGLQSAGAWLYYSFVKINDSKRLAFVNGVQVGSSTTTATETPTTTSGTALQFGNTNNSNTVVPVTYDMTRISNIARYIEGQSFTPPTTAFTNDKNTWFLSSWENTYVPSPSPT
jgi:hypothetical protein